MNEAAVAVQERDPVAAKKALDQAKALEIKGERLGAITAYETAYEADPEHPEVCFRLAFLLDSLGEEEEAIHLYEEVANQPKPFVNALINLAVLYEDRGQYSQAERLIRQVLATNPNHHRARTYLKDILASKQLVTAAVGDDKSPRSSALLETPVTDFDLSVRARNALRKMSIRTLGDLLKISETELRNFKNFGEASLEEIKNMLAQKGLRLGQAIDQKQNAVKEAVYEQLKNESGETDESMSRSVGELNLSVRARKALELLNVQSLGDLCMKTEAELMGVKNFGMTSLLEIKNKLASYNLGLRKLEG
jgi:DNA-directed RNA polymerase subunit alpha